VRGVIPGTDAMTRSADSLDAGGTALATSPLRDLIRRARVGAVFQPIVDLCRGSIVAYEALTRPDAASGFDTPADLFEVAAHEGLLWELEEVTRRASLQAAGNWPEGVRLFLNCTPEVFADPRFVPAIAGAVRPWHGPDDGRLRADRLVIEVTERAGEDAVDALRRQRSALSDLGVQIAIDDVGVGTSGLSRIMALRPQWLKLDREFAAGIGRDAMKRNLVRFFVHFAGLSGINVIAEGIEDRDELAELIGLGVRYGQGYLLGRPAPRAAGLDRSLSAGVRAEWARAAADAAASLQTTPVVRLCRPAMLVQASAAAAEVLDLLALEPDFEGAVVFDGRRCVGSCSRDTLAAAVRFRGAQTRAGAVAVASPPVAPDTTLAEALQIVVARRDEELASPLVVADGADVVGVLTVRDLLRAAAAARGADQEPVARCGLAGRDDAERTIESLAAAGPESGAGRGLDAAFLDVRHFAHVTGMYGSRVADRLVESLGDLLRRAVIDGHDRTRAWHLGNDRFLVVAPAGELEGSLRRLLDEFDGSCGVLGCSVDRPCDRPGGRGDATSTLHHGHPKVSIRALLIPAAFERARTAADLYRIEQHLRQRAHALERGQAEPRSLLVADERLGLAVPVRASA
jgi:EAL domain-containing protein (putative c-di-GMP-specific phosphodiesterase class I)/CBS domain-containing protein